jgi:hypothetical protein
MPNNSSFQGTNVSTPGNTFSLADQNLNPLLKDYWFGSREASQQEISNDIVSRFSNLGSVNPNKGPTARSLFYNAANLYGDDAKYGQFLFYSFSNNSNTFRQEYYQSEQTQFNPAMKPWPLPSQVRWETQPTPVTIRLAIQVKLLVEHLLLIIGETFCIVNIMEQFLIIT